MRYNNMKGRLGVRRKRRNYTVRKRVIVPYGRELRTGGVR